MIIIKSHEYSSRMVNISGQQMRVVKHLSRLPGQVMKAPSLQILKTQLVVFLDSLLSVALLEQGVGPDAPEVLPTSTTL